MPHCELKYSSDLDIDARALLQAVQDVFERHDSTAGDCKGRAYPTDQFLHTHLIAEITLLRKAHRDEAFMTALRNDLAESLRAALPAPCWMSMTLTFSNPDYLTEYLE